MDVVSFRLSTTTYSPGPSCSSSASEGVVELSRWPLSSLGVVEPLKSLSSLGVVEPLKSLSSLCMSLVGAVAVGSSTSTVAVGRRSFGLPDAPVDRN
jgi:hypothetical protein